MKVLLIGEANSSHIIKWATQLSKTKVTIGLVALTPLNKDSQTVYSTHPDIVIFTPKNTLFISKFKGLRTIASYLNLRTILTQFQPDIVHAHYALSSGFLGALVNVHPFIVSVWGKDVFTYPFRSIFYKLILKFVLNRSDHVLSTSHIMAAHTRQFTQKPITVIPFGIDLDQFKPLPKLSLFSNPETIVVGTIKTLDPKYGIHLLIEAFAILKQRNPSRPLGLFIGGDGPQKQALEALVATHALTQEVLFFGAIPFSKVPLYHNALDIFVNVSIENSESFGVAVIEASACQKPVIVSNIGGLPEVVQDQITGLFVPPNTVMPLVLALEKLLLDPTLRQKMGESGRHFVKTHYDIVQNVRQTLDIYQSEKAIHST